jgi:hypothetical protein
VRDWWICEMGRSRSGVGVGIPLCEIVLIFFFFSSDTVIKHL